MSYAFAHPSFGAAPGEHGFPCKDGFCNAGLLCWNGLCLTPAEAGLPGTPQCGGGSTWSALQKKCVCPPGADWSLEQNRCLAVSSPEEARRCAATAGWWSVTTNRCECAFGHKYVPGTGCVAAPPPPPKVTTVGAPPRLPPPSLPPASTPVQAGLFGALKGSNLLLLGAAGLAAATAVVLYQKKRSGKAPTSSRHAMLPPPPRW